MIQPGSVIGHAESPERMAVIVAASEHSRWPPPRSYKAHMLGTGMVEDRLFWHGFTWDDTLVIVEP